MLQDLVLKSSASLTLHFLISSYHMTMSLKTIFLSQSFLLRSTLSTSCTSSIDISNLQCPTWNRIIFPLTSPIHWGMLNRNLRVFSNHSNIQFSRSCLLNIYQICPHLSHHRDPIFSEMSFPIIQLLWIWFLSGQGSLTPPHVLSTLHPWPGTLFPFTSQHPPRLPT